MNAEILEKLIEYIDAAIDEKIDDMESSDGGLISSIRKSEVRAELESLVFKANAEQDRGASR